MSNLLFHEYGFDETGTCISGNAIIPTSQNINNIEQDMKVFIPRMLPFLSQDEIRQQRLEELAEAVAEAVDKAVAKAVAAAVAVAVDTRLHLAHAQLHGHERVGHRHVAIVVAVDPHGHVEIGRPQDGDRLVYADGERKGKLEVVGKVAKNVTGTTVRFWPNPKYFDSPAFSLARLKHVLRAKAVLCPGLEVTLEVGMLRACPTLRIDGDGSGPHRRVGLASGHRSGRVGQPTQRRS